MNLTSTQKMNQLSTRFLSNLRYRSNTYIFAMIIIALVAFEFFSFSSTDFALRDILGDMGVGFLRWSTILALAFCGLDFAGMARLLLPQSKNERAEPGSWFLLGAWVLAAAMNTALTWWGISVAIYNQPVDSVLIMDPMMYVTVIPVLVAVIIWCIRILIIGTLVFSFNRPSTSKTAAENKQTPSMGFQPAEKTVPPGYKPMPSGARAQHYQ